MSDVMMKWVLLGVRWRICARVQLTPAPVTKPSKNVAMMYSQGRGDGVLK